GDRIGVDEGGRHDEEGGERRHPGAVPQRVHQRRGGEIVRIVGKSDKPAFAVLNALGQQRGERAGDGEQQKSQQREYRRAHRNPLGGEAAPGRDPGRQRHGLASARSSNTRSRSGGRATVSVWPSRIERSRMALAEKSERSTSSGAALGRNRARQK